MIGCKTYSIYVITSPSGLQYVGLDKNGSDRVRFRDHIKRRNSKKFNYPIRNAIAKYGKENMKFEIIEDNLTREEAQIRECFWIKELNTMKPNGYNLTSGGEVSKTYCDEVRQKISKSRTGFKMAEETKQKIAKALSGRIFTEEHLKNLSKPHKVARTPEHCLKLSLAKKGKVGPWKGRSFTEEHRRNIGKSSRGRKWSKEARERFSKIRTGDVRSDETRAKISVARKKYWADKADFEVKVDKFLERNKFKIANSTQLFGSALNI